MQKKLNKIDKFGKQLETNLKEEVEKIQAIHDKWATKIDHFKSQQKHLENQSFKQGKEQSQAVREYLESKRLMEKLKHSESMQNQSQTPGVNQTKLEM